MSRAKRTTYLLGAAVLMGLALLVDGWSYRHLVLRDVYERDWGRMLRVAGYLPTWIIAAAGMALADRRVRTWRDLALAPGAFVVYAATVGGIGAELLKLVIRRERPDAGHGAYLFRAWSDHPFSSSGLGMPSSHALVAFSAAAMLGLIYPRGRALWFALAVGCALTRVASGAHFLSDVVLSATVGPVVAAGLWTAYSRSAPKSGGSA